MDVAAWLRDLGLERYAQAFCDAEVTPEVLAELTDADLRELGLPLGPRKAVLKAIRDLAGPPAAEAARAEAGLMSIPVPPRAERRQLTVMFVDLVGSTALSARLDPEEMGKVLRAYQDAVAGEVLRWEGHVAKFMGDGVLAYFGWPKAHEDEAERAVRAGLAVIEVVGDLLTPTGEPLAARVGIATGLVVVGELVGEGGAREEAVVGETPNLAARLQGIAPAGAVVVGEATRRLLGGLFALEDLGARVLKGIAEPVRAFRVVGENPVEDRFGARQTGGVLPLVGREHELALLVEHWRRAKAGEGRVVLLAGEPGIGKSRLVLALRERLRSERRTRLSYHCSPHRIGSPLWPVVEQLERAAGFARGDPPELKLGKLEALLGQAVADPKAAMPVLAELLALPVDGRYPAPSLTPEQTKARIFQVLLAQLEGVAARGPVLMILEDAHWLDPTTLELFELVVGRVEHLHVLLVVTCRPGFDPPWSGHAHVTPLNLTRLGRDQAAEVVGRVTGGRMLPPEVLRQILDKTDGVPLFVEELTKAVLEAGLLHVAGDRYELAGPLPPLAIPSTLQDSLMARLDRLAPAREVAQLGAVIGREFSHELLAAAAGMPADRLEAALERLIVAELVVRRGAGPETAYAFKHALVQDAAYASLLKSRRQEFHARLARILEERFPERVEAQPELMARHCTEAALAEKAVEHWRRAGQLASGRSALAEAVGHFGKALELLATLPDTPARAAQELDLLTAQGGALAAARGYSAAETGRVYARARELCRLLGDAGRLHPLLFGEWVFRMVRADHAAAQETGEELLRSGEGDRDGGGTARLLGHRAVGISLLWRGNPSAAREHLERVLVLYDPERHRSLASLYVYDPRLPSLAGLCFALFQLGYPEQALARCHEAISEAERLAHPAGLAHILHHACLFEHARRDPAGVRQRAVALVALCAEQGFPYWGAIGAIFQGWVVAEQGRPAEGGARIEEGIAAYRATGAAVYLPYWLALLADARRASGQAEEAVALLREALDRSEASGERWSEAELLRLKGEGLLRLGERDRAEACLRRAISVARGQGAKLWELRAAGSLSRLWRDQGRRAEAHDLLAPVYGRFTEGFATPDLIEAKELLDAL